MIKPEQHPCWIVTCDRCSDSPGSDDIGVIHFDTEAAARAVVGGDWLEAHGVMVCQECLEGGHVEEAIYPCPGCGADKDAPCADHPSWSHCDERLDAFAAHVAALAPEQREEDR